MFFEEGFLVVLTRGDCRTQAILYRPYDEIEDDVDNEGALKYSSNALYFTARPENWWVQFKGGVVQVEYQTLVKNENNTGYGLGMGVVLDYGNFRIHLIDYQRLTFGSDSFNVYTMSIGVMAN